MKYLSILSIITILLFTACGTSNEEYDGEMYLPEGSSNYEATGKSFFSGGKRKKSMIHKVVNPQNGMVSNLVPMPSNWKLESNAWKGPQGSEVNFYQGKNFQGNRYRNANQVLQQVILPQLRKDGIQVDGVIDLPGVTQNNRNTWSKFWKAMPTNDFLEAKGIEMTNPVENEKGLMVVNFFYTASQYGSFSGYYCSILTSKPKNYEEDKRDVINALANMEMTPEALAAHNQKEQMRSNQSWAAHRQRMANNQALFEAGQAAARTNSEIGDIIHDGYMKRSRMQDAGHQKTIDMIREERPAINPYNGQEFRVQQGYKFYYMNQYGQILPSNDPFFNPENDPRYNQMSWRKVNTR